MRDNIKDNIKTFMVMEKELEKKYPNKIIAMYNGDVISVGDTYIDTIEKAKKKAKVTKLFIHRLGPSKDMVAILNTIKL